MGIPEEPTEKRSDTDGEVLTFMRLQEKYKQVYQPHEIAAWWEDLGVLIEMAPIQEEHAASAIQDAFKEQQKHKEKKNKKKQEDGEKTGKKKKNIEKATDRADAAEQDGEKTGKKKKTAEKKKAAEKTTGEADAAEQDGEKM